MKSYCAYCKWFKPYYGAAWIKDRCVHPDNIERVDTPISFYYTEKYYYENKNKNNDCKDYQKKWWLFWIKD